MSARVRWAVLALAAVIVGALLLSWAREDRDSEAVIDWQRDEPAATQPEAPGEPVPAVRPSSDDVRVVRGSRAEQALATSQLLWARSPLVVLAMADDPAAVSEAAAAAVSLRAPLLLAEPDAAGPDRPDPDVSTELDRLDATSVVLVGDSALPVPDGVDALTVGQAEAQRVDRDDEILVLTTSGPLTTAAIATAEAAGARVVVMSGDDPREEPAARKALSKANGALVVGIGNDLGPSRRFAPLVATAATGVELPGGGQTLFPSRRLVALYGHPSTPLLGVLGEQGPKQSVERARQLAESYQPFSSQQVVPAFEIITTMASAGAGEDGDYSREVPVKEIEPYVDAAEKAGVYVVLDLQPGRSTFLSQAKRYRTLLERPHVGLALDPEWRLKPNEVHLRQVGTMKAAEVNRVATWLARLVRENALPQKMLLLHQFQIRMIENRETIDAQRDELAVVVQMDGQGTPVEKGRTWRAIKRDRPDGVRMGWKNFYDEDVPTLTPEQTMSITPKPWWVSYQ